MRIAGIALVSLVLSVSARDAICDIFKFVDNAGHVFYTDRPNHAGYRRIIRSPLAVVSSRPKSGIIDSFRLSNRGGGLSPGAERQRRYFADLIDSAADRYRLDPALLHAVIRAESAYNPNAVSDKGAAGLMQLMPATAQRYGVRDRLNPVENIEGGARYLSDLLGMFQSDVKLAVAAYNAGENSVKRHGYQIPPIQETRDYVVRVLDYYRRMN
jgi:hypothetical protein